MESKELSNLTPSLYNAQKFCRINCWGCNFSPTWFHIGTSDSKEYRGKVTRFRFYNLLLKKKKKNLYKTHGSCKSLWIIHAADFFFPLSFSSTAFPCTFQVPVLGPLQPAEPPAFIFRALPTLRLTWGQKRLRRTANKPKPCRTGLPFRNRAAPGRALKATRA